MGSYYVMLTTLTDEGRKTIRKNPDRIKEVNQEAEKWGLKILSQYALLGEYDFINIIEAPDNETVTKAAVTLSARGTIKTITYSAIPVDEFINSIKYQSSP